MKRINGVIFDMDGVIFDTERLWKRAFDEANVKYGLSLSEEYRQSTCGKSEKDIRQELCGLFPSLDINEYRTGMLDYVMKHIESGDFEVKSSFLSIIDYLKKKKVKTALATSSHRARALKLFALKSIDSESLFDARIFCEDIGGRSKPDPFIFLKAAELIGVPPKNCFVVEDSVNGIEAAYRGGFLPVMAVDLIEPDAYCLEHTTAIINDLSELKNLLGEVK